MKNLARQDASTTLYGTSAGTTPAHLMMNSHFSVLGPKPTSKKGSMSAERRKLRAETLLAEVNNPPINASGMSLVEGPGYGGSLRRGGGGGGGGPSGGRGGTVDMEEQAVYARQHCWDYVEHIVLEEKQKMAQAVEHDWRQRAVRPYTPAAYPHSYPRCACRPAQSVCLLAHSKSQR